MKKIIAIALALVMCLGIMSMVAFAAPEGLNSLAVVGSGIPGVAEWDPKDAAGDMTEVSDGVFTKTLDCAAGTSMKLKIAGNDAWDDNWNFGSATLVLGQKADLTNGAGSTNMTLTVAKAGKITITVGGKLVWSSSSVRCDPSADGHTVLSFAPALFWSAVD